MTALRAIVLLAPLLIVGCGDSAADKAMEQELRGRVIVKVCRDGSRVFRAPDGHHYVGGLGGARVDNPETVCQ